MINFDVLKTDPQASQTSVSQEQEARLKDVSNLLEGFVGRSLERFEDPDSRLDFIQGLSAKNFFRLSQYANARLRGESPYKLRQNPDERLGGQLPMLHTPRSTDKLRSFSRGFDAIQEYLAETEDPVDKKIEGVAMAAEALIIWVHPFVDGNGRTSRFIGKLIEDGGVDSNALSQETVSAKARPNIYGRQKLPSKQSETKVADNEEIMLDDGERAEIRSRAKGLPDDDEAMYRSVKRLLENDAIRQSVTDAVEKFRAQQQLRSECIASQAAKVAVAA